MKTVFDNGHRLLTPVEDLSGGHRVPSKVTPGLLKILGMSQDSLGMTVAVHLGRGGEERLIADFGVVQSFTG